MRKQYHLRESPSGLLAWDVDKLIKITKGLSPREIPLDSIREIDKPFWFLENGPKPTCRNVALHARLIQECDLSFPIIIDPDGRVMDGMHRVCKALNLGRKMIAAFQLKSLPDPDFTGVPEDQLPYD